MAVIFWRGTDDDHESAESVAGRAQSGAVTEQHPLPIQLEWKSSGEDEFVSTDDEHPLPVRVMAPAPVESPLFLIQFQLIATTVVAYSANDALGSVFALPVPRNGIIQNVKLADVDDDTLGLTLHLFSKPLTGVADNAAFTVTAAEVKSWVTSVVLTTTPLDIGGGKVMENVSTWVPSHYYTEEGFLYGQASITGTPTIAAGLMPWVTIGILPGRRVIA